MENERLTNGIDGQNFTKSKIQSIKKYSEHFVI